MFIATTVIISFFVDLTRLGVYFSDLSNINLEDYYILGLVSISSAILGAFIFGFISSKIYDYGPKRKGTTNLKDWIWLFFLSIFTHPILDSFTPYGTQLANQHLDGGR